MSPNRRSYELVQHELKTSPVRLEYRESLDATLTLPSLAAFDVAILESETLQDIGELKALAPHLPVVLLHESANHRVGLAAIREGASEYLSMAEMQGGTLFRALRYCVERAKVEGALEASREQLFRTQKMEAIGRTMVGIAHDFRHFLQVVYGNCGLMKRLNSDPMIDEMVEEIRTAGDRANEVMTHLLNFAHGRRSKENLIEVQRVFANLKPLIRALFRGGQRLILEAGPNALLVRFDERIEQVVMNLAVNAVDALGAEGGVITVEARALILDRPYADAHFQIPVGSYVVVEVSDDGCGIEPELLDRVFEPFFTTKPRNQGSGIGLSMVFATVKEWGGQVSVVSRPGFGSTFKMVLPSEPAGAPAGPIEPISSRVTLLEDDGPLRLLLRRDLAALSCEVDEKPNGPDNLLVCEYSLEGPQRGLMVCEFSPLLLRTVGALSEEASVLRTPFSRQELNRALKHLASKRVPGSEE